MSEKLSSADKERGEGGDVQVGTSGEVNRPRDVNPLYAVLARLRAVESRLEVELLELNKSEENQEKGEGLSFGHFGARTIIGKEAHARQGSRTTIDPCSRR